MSDKVEKLGSSLIQHGSYNNRIYLMNLNQADFPSIFKRLDNLAKKNSYSKIFAKVPKWAFNQAKKYNYSIEAIIPGFFNGSNEGYFLGKYFLKSRAEITKQTHARIKKVIAEFKKYKKLNVESCEPESIIIKLLSPDNINALAELYETVFESYPFPINNKDYLKKTMNEDVKYYGVFLNNKLVAASSAEIDMTHSNVEMTDFATYPQYRGQNFAYFLLSYMEKQMQMEEIKTAYTIARACSYGMNISFAKKDYHYAGLLINNTNISGSFESMNVLYKSLQV